MIVHGCCCCRRRHRHCRHCLCCWCWWCWCCVLLHVIQSILCTGWCQLERKAELGVCDATLCDESGNGIKRSILAGVYGEIEKERESDSTEYKNSERELELEWVNVCMPNEIQLYTFLYGPRWVAFDRALVIYLLHISPLVFGRSFVRFVLW